MAEMTPNIEQIRRRMLTLARIQGPLFEHGFVPASLFCDTKDDEGLPEGKLSDDQAIDQLGWLSGEGLLEEDVRQVGGGAKGFRHRRFRMTRKAWLLWSGDHPPIPGVADKAFGD